MFSTLLGKGRALFASKTPDPAEAAGKQPGAPGREPDPPPSETLERRQLSRIAQGSVQLAALGPRLAALATEMEAQARTQAARAEAMAETMSGLTRDLDEAVAALRASSGHMEDAVGTVERIADSTRLLSINASIEAARAGVEGRTFAVVVEEVRQLSDRTAKT